jgi:hypothetical protein
MDPLFDRLDAMFSQNLLTEDELEMIKASVVELALGDDVDLEQEPDFTACDGRSLVIHAREACGEAGIDLADDAEEVSDDDDVVTDE